MSKLGDFIKKVGNTLGDVGKGIAKVAVSPVNAITGHEYNPTMKTKLGNVLEKFGDGIEDVQGAAINTATLGLAKKIGIADGERETKLGTVIGSVVGAGAIAAGGIELLGGAGTLKGLISKAPVLKSSGPKIYQEENFSTPEMTFQDKILTPSMPLKMISDSHTQTMKDSLSVATVANVKPPDFTDVAKTMLVQENTTEPKSVVKSALSGIGSLLTPTQQTKVSGVLDSINGIFGRKTTTLNGQTQNQSQAGGLLLIGGLILLLVLIFKR